MSNKPLENIVILDLSRVLAGPFATRIAADLGARIIKVEPPETGDDTRSYGPFIKDFSGYFLSLNHGKESIQLNLKHPNDRRIFEELCAKSDVLIENYRAGTMDKLGYGWKYIEKHFPRLIYCAVSGFGQTGPYSDRPAYDMVVQAMGGLMSITGEEGGEPVRVGSSIGDITAALYAAIAINGCLYKREKTGKGSYIDIGMLDCQLAILENALIRYTIGKEIPTPIGARHPSITPFGAFRTRDNRIIIAVGNNHLFKNLCDAIGGEGIFADPDYATNDLRNRHVKALTRDIEAILTTKDTAEWVEILNKFSVPCSPIHNIKDVIHDPQIKARKMIIHVDDPELGSFKVAGNPIKINGVMDNMHQITAPRLNQHRTQILKDFNINE